ncbi:kinase-like protein [Apiospora saccharicola]|uniref:Kinase-like protein n=1 Tax=Apiospora saccharicola TaxID=335842 RepID=A0ABR1U1W4_9PEZI
MENWSNKWLGPPPGAVAVRKDGMGQLKRLPVADKPLDHIYERVKTIDDGKGGLGGMNAGVYIVRKRDDVVPLFYVEKRYRSDNINLVKLFREEIGYMRVSPTNRRRLSLPGYHIQQFSDLLVQQLMHSGIVQYVQAYIGLQPPYEASAYMEYCDRGSLKDMIQIYSKERQLNNDRYIPESFIWHAFLGMADVLYFLKTGQSFISVELQKNDPRNWKPIIHCDIKPDRHLPPLPRHPQLPEAALRPPLRLRRRVPRRRRRRRRRKQPPAPPPAPAPAPPTPANSAALPCAATGTLEYHAPELCFDPCPTPRQANPLQQATPHTSRSDAPQLVEGVQKQCRLWMRDPNWQAQVAEGLPPWAAPKRTVK